VRHPLLLPGVWPPVYASHFVFLCLFCIAYRSFINSFIHELSTWRPEKKIKSSSLMLEGQYLSSQRSISVSGCIPLLTIVRRVSCSCLVLKLFPFVTEPMAKDCLKQAQTDLTQIAVKAIWV